MPTHHQIYVKNVLQTVITAKMILSVNFALKVISFVLQIFFVTQLAKSDFLRIQLKELVNCVLYNALIALTLLIVANVLLVITWIMKISVFQIARLVIMKMWRQILVLFVHLAVLNVLIQLIVFHVNPHIFLDLTKCVSLLVSQDSNRILRQRNVKLV